MKDEIKEILDKLKESAIWYEDSKQLLDYITNLQERCEYLERSNNRREDEIMSLRDECTDGETYKSRNEKAIEYINKHTTSFKDIFIPASESWYLLELLNGENNKDIYLY